MSNRDEREKMAAYQAMDRVALLGTLDSDFRFAVVNAKLLAFLGWTKEQIVGRSFEACLDESLSDEFVSMMKSMVSRGSIWKGELRHRGVGGYPLWSEASIVPLVDPTKKVNGYQLIAFDVTERKSVEFSLAASQNFMREMMESAPVGFLVGESSGACTYVNRTWVEMSGRTLVKALGLSWLEAVHPEDRAEVEASWRGLLDSGTSLTGEYRYLKADGSITWVLASAIRVDHGNGGRVRYLRVEQDLTERRRAAQLLEEQRAKAVSAAKLASLGEMAGGIAHEINNPLAIIAARAMQISDLVADGASTPEVLKKAADSITAMVSRTSKIIKSMRSLAGDSESETIETSSLKALIEESLVLCAERMKSSSVALRLHPPEESLIIECRPVAICQAIVNLLNNAHQAVAGLDERWIEIQVADRGDSVEIGVTDSGTGLAGEGPPQEMREKIFQPFFTTKPIGKGVGLGLSVSRSLIEAHGGRLEVDPASRNTRFEIRLPKRQTTGEAVSTRDRRIKEGA